MARNGTIYRIQVKTAEPGTFLVEASNRAAALAHVTKSLITVDRATPAEIHELATKGVKLERAAQDGGE